MQMQKMLAMLEMVLHWAFLICECMFLCSFFQDSFGLSDVTFSAAWTRNFINHVRFHQFRGFIFSAGEGGQLRCIEEAVDLYLLFWIQEAIEFLPKSFDQIITSRSDIREVYPNGYNIWIFFSFWTCGFRLIDEFADQLLPDVTRKAIPRCKFVYIFDAIFEVSRIA